MKHIAKYILGIAFLASYSYCHAQQIKGYIMSIDSSKTVPLANFTNMRSGQKFIANRNGFFRVNVTITDSISISAIGYEPVLLVGKDVIPENIEDTIAIYLRPKAYQLRDVTIIYSDKRRDSIAQLAAEFLSKDPLMNNYDRVLNRNQGGLMNPLTALWNEYSKEGRDMRKFEEFVRHAEMLKQVNSRYNKKAIKRATGIDDEHLDDYILFCKMNKAFVLTASDYDLIKAMRECGDRFKREKGIE